MTAFPISHCSSPEHDTSHDCLRLIHVLKARPNMGAVDFFQHPRSPLGEELPNVGATREGRWGQNQTGLAGSQVPPQDIFSGGGSQPS